MVSETNEMKKTVKGLSITLFFLLYYRDFYGNYCTTLLKLSMSLGSLTRGISNLGEMLRKKSVSERGRSNGNGFL